jgi:hypothetical protein
MQSRLTRFALAVLVEFIGTFGLFISAWASTFSMPVRPAAILATAAFVLSVAFSAVAIWAPGVATRLDRVAALLWVPSSGSAQAGDVQPQPDASPIRVGRVLGVVGVIVAIIVTAVIVLAFTLS